MERRKFLSCLGAGSAAVVVPGISAADRGNSDSVQEFLRLYERWNTEYGDVVDVDLDFSIESDNYKRADITYIFESGDEKTITAIESDQLIIIYRRYVFRIDDPEKFYNKFSQPTIQSNTSEPDPGAGGGRSEPINPGDQITWASASGSHTDTSSLPDVSYNGAGANEFEFHAEARTSGAVASWNDALSKVYTRFEVGNDGSHPNTTMRMQIPFDLVGRFEAWGGGSAEARVLLYLANLTRGEYVTEKTLVDHSQTAYGSEVYNEEGTETIERQATPGHEYEVGAWVSTAATGAGVAFAEANFKYGTNYGIGIEEIDLSWI